MQTTKDYVKLFFKQNKFVTFVSALVFIILSTTYSIVSWIMQVIFDYMAGNSTYSFESILLMLGVTYLLQRHSLWYNVVYILDFLKKQ